MAALALMLPLLGASPSDATGMSGPDAVGLVRPSTPPIAGEPSGARTDDRAKPVIFIHGSDWTSPFGVDCRRSFGDMKRKLRDWGHTGPLVAVAFYTYDANCDLAIGHHGAHTKHRGVGHAKGGHSGATYIEHLGYHLAWFIYDHYSSGGRPVDVVGHSMGPLLVRYALAQVERGHSDFPPGLLVEDVVALAAPWAGAKPIIETCGWRACRQMRPGSALLDWLADNAWEPDGEGGTDWTVIGAVDDNYVSATSAVAMGACHKVQYLNAANVEHGDLLHDISRSPSADARVRNCPGGWKTSTTTHWPVRRTDLAVTYGKY